MDNLKCLGKNEPKRKLKQLSFQKGAKNYSRKKYTHSNNYLTQIEEHLYSHNNINTKYY